MSYGKASDWPPPISSTKFLALQRRRKRRGSETSERRFVVAAAASAGLHRSEVAMELSGDRKRKAEEDAAAAPVRGNIDG